MKRIRQTENESSNGASVHGYAGGLPRQVKTAPATRPRLVILSQFVYPDQNATARIVTSLATGLVKHGFEVGVYAAQPSYFEESASVPSSIDYQGIRIRRLRSTHFGRVSISARLVDSLTFSVSMAWCLALMPRDAVVIALTNPPLLPWLGALSKLVFGNRLVIVVHDVYPDIAAQLGVIKKGGQLHRSLAAIQRFAYQQADSIIVLGRDMLRVVANYVPNGGQNAIVIIPNWADDPALAPTLKSGSETARKQGLLDSFVVQYSGNLGMSQNLEIVVEAAKVLKDENVHFVLVGEGPRRENLRRLVLATGLTNVRFLPRVPEESLSDSLAACDAALVPLADGIEGLSVPSKYYGILASGKPVLAAMASDAEVALSVTEDRTGLVVPPGDAGALADAILSLKRDPAMARALGENARSAYERRYTRDRAVDEYARLLSMVTDRPVDSSALRSLPLWTAASIVVFFTALAIRVPTVLAGLPLAVTCGALLWKRTALRLPFVVFGGVAILSSSHDLSLLKLAYLAGVIVAFVAGLRHSFNLRATITYKLVRPMFLGSVLLALVVGASFIVALTYGTRPIDWLRDATPYLLLCTIPVFLVDAQPLPSKRVLIGMLLIAGLASGISFSVLILARRYPGLFPVDHFVLSSPQLAVAVLCYSISSALLSSGRRLWWAVLAALVFSILFVTGTRSFLLLGIAVPATIVAARSKDYRAWLRPILISVLVATVLVMLGEGVTSIRGGDPAELFRRLATIPQTLLHPNSDPSYQERVLQTSSAWNAFVSHPLMGVGPGHIFVWRTWNGTSAASFNIDTTLSFPAKFGLAGIVALLSLAVGVIRLVRSASVLGSSRVEPAALFAYGVVVVCLMPFGAVLEDKALTFGLMLLLAIGLATAAKSQAGGKVDRRTT